MNKLKKILPLFLLFVVTSCNNNSSPTTSFSTNSEQTSATTSISTSSKEPTYLETLTNDEKENLSIQGYAEKGIGDFSQYIGSDSYRVVTNEDEFINALFDAKYEYETIFDETTSTYTQNLIKEGSVHVIEITNDLNLGYFKLSSEAKKVTQIVSDYASNYNKWKDYLYFSDMFLENGISQIKIERTSNLMIYSKNGAKITHAGFKLTSCDNIVFRNISFDEIWQWDDAPTNETAKIGDYDWFGWSYFKIGFCGYIWIDHCEFGKSYDGQIDYANANYHSTKSTSFRAPYGATGGKGLSITWCNFNSGSDDKEGYLYKMMQDIEKDYQDNVGNCLYYKALRDKGISFEDVFYGLALPQKKGFLIGDDQDYSENNHVEYDYNLELNVSFANCNFTNLEDRLPKVRGGNVYMHNCLFDSSEYYEYRTSLQGQRVVSTVTAVNSSWKCALVSQGIVCGQGGSVRADNCIFLGINTLLKNNDSGSPAPYLYGGYELNNCRYKVGSTDYTGSSSDENHKFKNSNTSSLKTEYFKWNTIDGLAPYTPKVLIDLDDLETLLEDETKGAGINLLLQDELMKFKY